MTSHECHWVSNQQRLIVKLLFQAINSKKYTKAGYYLPFVKEIHQWLVDSLHRGPVILKAFPCSDIMYQSWYQNLWKEARVVSELYWSWYCLGYWYSSRSYFCNCKLIIYSLDWWNMSSQLWNCLLFILSYSILKPEAHSIKILSYQNKDLFVEFRL